MKRWIGYGMVCMFVAAAIPLLAQDPTPSTVMGHWPGSDSTKYVTFFKTGNVTVTGTLTAGGVSGAIGGTTPAAGAFTEATVDGKYAVTGGDATTGLMIQKAGVTSGTNATQTVTFAVVYGAAPIVVCAYTEDPGDVRPIFVTSVTATNFVANITADKNFGYIAVGTRP